MREITRGNRHHPHRLKNWSRNLVLFHDHPQPMWIYDLETLRFLQVNQAALAQYGYSEAEFLAMTIRDIRPRSEYGRLSENLANTPASGRARSGTWIHLRKDGSRISVEISSHTVLLDGRRCRFVLAHDVTERQRMETALFSSDQMHRRLIDHLPYQIFWKDRELRYLGCNQVFADAAQLRNPAEVEGKCERDFPWAVNAERIRADDLAVIASGQPRLNVEDELAGADGKMRHYLINKLPLHDQAGQIVGVLGTIEDVTATRRAEHALRLQSRALEASANAIVITVARGQDHVIEYANPAFTRMTGYTLDEVLGRDCRFLQGQDRDQEGRSAIRNGLRHASETTLVLRNYRKDGALFYNELRIAPVSDAHGRVTHHVGVMTDMTLSLRYQAELEHKANYDTLSGLPNRNLFNDRLEQALVYAARDGHALWVGVIDLDNFKLVNDSLGHDIGDRLLQIVGRRLRACVRDCDTVARLGGDEFLLLLLDHPQAPLTPLVLAQLQEALAAPLQVDQHELSLTCSTGLAVYPKDGSSGAVLLKHADMAMYRAKDVGRNQWQFFTAEMNARIIERTRIEAALRYAVARNELVLHYQPRVELASGRVVGMEALVRWQHPEMGLVAPARFIAVAEETGLILDIGDWVLRTACAQNRAWQQAGLPAMRVAVNTSARQFRQASFADSVLAALRDSGLAPCYLELELTESLLMQDIDATVATLVDLRKLGVAHSIDDFGTGYSSLNYLMRFPIDYLKIDQSFVRDMVSNPNGATIVRSMIALGHGLGFKIIAEGVETQAQRAYLERHGCDEIQGYLFSRPLTAEAMGAMLASGQSMALGDRDGEAQPTLLLLDDEPRVMASLYRLLRQDGYRILRADTPEQAFALLATHAVQVIVCDQRMPLMSGTEFLHRVKQIHPDTIRIILSGFTELESVIDAINRGSIFRFYTKPWDDQALRQNIRDAFAQQRMLLGVADGAVAAN